MKKTKAPTPEDAENYVWQGIHGIGGWSEGLGGFWLKTIPGILGKGRALTVIGVFALISRLAIVVLAAIFPLIVRKLALLTPSAASTQQPVNALGTLDVFQNALQTSTLVDYILGLVAVVLVGLPKALDMFEREAKAEHHSPFKDLSAAIRSLPIREKISATETADTIRFTLLALREECPGQVFSYRPIGCLIADFCSKALGGKLPSVECNRWLL